jgi:hypothetical protein
LTTTPSISRSSCDENSNLYFAWQATPAIACHLKDAATPHPPTHHTISQHATHRLKHTDHLLPNVIQTFAQARTSPNARRLRKQSFS